LHGLPKKVITRMMPRLEHLESAPRPPGCKKLKGGDNEWRIRVGDYRIVYVIDDAARTVDVTRIAHRRDVYE
jgi:mRNA interferase RelE/StbE